jgi:hemerythrin-like metal-binding protein
MSLVKWTPDFSVGIERFDAAHRHLISLLNKTQMSLGNCREAIILGAILGELVWYTRWHLRDEELHMKFSVYPGLGPHKAEHDRFRKLVDQFVDQFHAGQKSIAVDVLKALRDWLTTHILESDAAYARFFQADAFADEAVQMSPPFKTLESPSREVNYPSQFRHLDWRNRVARSFSRWKWGAKLQPPLSNREDENFYRGG